jgi:glutamate 5-kinase
MKIVIKVGTQSILSSDGTLLESRLVNLVRQMSKLHDAGHQIVLVSSGAVGSGRRVARERLGLEMGSSIGEKQVLASLGQHELMHAYSRLFEAHELGAAQLLLTRQDFQTRHHYLNIARLLHEIMERKTIIPVINENDSVSVEKLMFTDNDELSGLIAAQINADRLIILTSVAGVYDGNPDKPGAKLIPVIDPEKGGWPEVSTSKTAMGRGGMMSKLDTARKMSGLGITTHIAATSEKDVLERLLGANPPGTRILPQKKKSSLKKWMAYSTEKGHGAIRINQTLYELLKESKKVISILPVGIQSCTGDFEKGDLVEISGPDGKKIGSGIARYGAEKLHENLGVKGKPVFIHYDHLHLDTGT